MIVIGSAGDEWEGKNTRANNHLATREFMGGVDHLQIALHCSKRVKSARGKRGASTAWLLQPRSTTHVADPQGCQVSFSLRLLARLADLGIRAWRTPRAYLAPASLLECATSMLQL